MARPRSITDERMLAATAAVIGRAGPGFTLADVAAEADISAGTLVHRFGSKHGLLLALIRDATAAAARELAAAPPAAGDPVAALRRAVVGRYAPLDDAASAANHLAQLAADLADPALREAMADLYAAIRAGVLVLVERAVRSGALPGAPAPAVAARILTATVDGAAVHWSARPRGSLRRRLATDLDAILAGWRRSDAEA